MAVAEGYKLSLIVGMATAGLFGIGTVATLGAYGMARWNKYKAARDYTSDERVRRLQKRIKMIEEKSPELKGDDLETAEKVKTFFNSTLRQIQAYRLQVSMTVTHKYSH